MDVRNPIKSSASFKRKLPKLLRRQGFRCANCNRKILRVAHVRKHRRTKLNIGKNLVWWMPCGVRGICPAATVDHIIPRWNGGKNNIENLQALCAECNAEKHVEETLHFRKRIPGVCTKCGKKAPPSRKKCDLCKAGEKSVIKIPQHKDKPNKGSPLKRALHINEQEWRWQAGKSGVVISNPERTMRWQIRSDVLLGLTWDEIERAHWKRSSTANITPAIVKDFIERVMIGGQAPSYDLYIVRGLPGSGKSTRALDQLKHYSMKYSVDECDPKKHIFSTDDYFYQMVEPEQPEKYSFVYRFVEAAHKWNWLRAQDAFIARRTPIIIDNVHTRPCQAKRYCVLAQAHGYKVNIIYPNTEVFRKFEEAYYYFERDKLIEIANELSKNTEHRQKIPAWKILRAMYNFIPRNQYTLNDIMESRDEVE